MHPDFLAFAAHSSSGEFCKAVLQIVFCYSRASRGCSLDDSIQLGCHKVDGTFELVLAFVALYASMRLDKSQSFVSSIYVAHPDAMKPSCQDE